jgi:hypothetical protein
MFVGVTVYPPATSKAVAKDTMNQVLPIKKGTNVTEVTLNPKYLNGTFEIATWTQKPPAGYMASYLWGYVYAQ